MIVATNRNLSKEVEKGQFREDLFYRLNVVSINMPPLRERTGDLPLLVRHFAEKISTELSVSMPEITESLLLPLNSYEWPGNVRELKNVLERSLLLKKTPIECINPSAGILNANTRSIEPNDERLASIEKHHMQRILGEENGNKSAAARRLDISRKTLERKEKLWIEQA
ncbi:MAG: DNA-binding NtrC family response regulator [Gammaproteobacteria bacterium]